MSSDPIIKCSGIGKAFQLYAHQNDQLEQVIFGYWKKFYKEKWVLNDISFSVKRGERVALLKKRGQWKAGMKPTGLPKTKPE